jgi:twitching motility two-component system response regulator PilH
MPESKQTVLIVDDSEEIREFFQLALEDAGYQVDTAANGEEAFAKIRARRPDVVVLDVVMPKMDGFELLLKLRSDLAPPVPPVILCSGFDVTEDEAFRRGAARFLRKPVDPRDLTAVVANVLAGRPSSAEAATQRHANVSLARQRACEAASRLLDGILAHSSASGESPEILAFEHASMLARYFHVDAVALALLRDDRLVVAAASENPVLAPGTDLGRVLPPAFAIIETGSSLILPDALAHPSFGPHAAGLDGMPGFVGVPVLVEKTVIGVLCALSARHFEVEPEDLSLFRLFSEACSSALSAWARGSFDEQHNGWHGGVFHREVFEQMLDAELRLLDRRGEALELAICDTRDVTALGEAVVHAPAPERLCAGLLGEHCAALYKRSSNGDARPLLAALLETVRVHDNLDAVGVVDLAVTGFAPFTAPDLIRLAELALEKTREAGGSPHRLVIEERE